MVPSWEVSSKISSSWCCAFLASRACVFGLSWDLQWELYSVKIELKGNFSNVFCWKKQGVGCWVPIWYQFSWLTYTCTFACWLLSTWAHILPAQNRWALPRFCAWITRSFARISGIANLLKKHGQQCRCWVTVPEPFLWPSSRTNVLFITSLFGEKE